MEGAELWGDAFLVVLFMREKQFYYLGVKLKKKVYLKEILVSLFYLRSSVGQWGESCNGICGANGKQGDN